MAIAQLDHTGSNAPGIAEMAAVFASEPAVSIACANILSRIASSSGPFAAKASKALDDMGVGADFSQSAGSMPLLLKGGPSENPGFLFDVMNRACLRVGSALGADIGTKGSVVELHLQIPPAIDSKRDDDLDAFIVAKAHQEIRAAMSSVEPGCVAVITISGLEKASNLVQEGVAEISDLVKSDRSVLLSVVCPSFYGSNPTVSESVSNRFLSVSVPSGLAPEPAPSVKAPRPS